MSGSSPDAVVVGAGPNGLAAALTLARAGVSVRLIEGAETIGGGLRSARFATPGFIRDCCAAVLPLAVSSPFFDAEDLGRYGVEFAHAPLCAAHPLEDGRAAVLGRSLEETADSLGVDGRRYLAMMRPLLEHASGIVEFCLSPMRALPADLSGAARFGVRAPLPVTVLARAFSGIEAKAMLGGLAAHAMRPLDSAVTGGYALLLAMLAHQRGWPVVRGGTGVLAAGLASALVEAGGEVVTGRYVRGLSELHGARAVLFDVAPTHFADIASDALGDGGRAAYRRFGYGPGVCKVDFALAGPVPWRARACRSATTVHVGGDLSEIALAEAAVGAGRHPERPFVLCVQATVADATRAPAGAATLWAYCHVPNGSHLDMSSRIESQIERFAPGFSDLVLERTVTRAVELAAYDANYVGGDINTGAATLRQTFFRPRVAWSPYRTPLAGVYLCSAATPPGGGVHGMCGYNAARAALTEVFGRAPGEDERPLSSPRSPRPRARSPREGRQGRHGTGGRW